MVCLAPFMVLYSCGADLTTNNITHDHAQYYYVHYVLMVWPCYMNMCKLSSMALASRYTLWLSMLIFAVLIVLCVPSKGIQPHPPTPPNQEFLSGMCTFTRS